MPTFQRGDIVSKRSGNPTGTLKVITVTDIALKDPITGQAQMDQLLKLRQIQPALAPDGQVIIWQNRPDINGGHYFDAYASECILVTSADQAP